MPVPELVMTPSFVSFPNVTPGFQATYNVSLENEGLVQVQNIAITGSQDNYSTLTPLITYMPALQPFQTVEVPYTFTWVGTNNPQREQDLGTLVQKTGCEPDFAGAINGLIEGLTDFMLSMANGLGTCQATGLEIPTIEMCIRDSCNAGCQFDCGPGGEFRAILYLAGAALRCD